MKTFCLDSQKDWDDGIYMLLFVVREAFQESLSLLLLMLLVSGDNTRLFERI